MSIIAKSTATPELHNVGLQFEDSQSDEIIKQEQALQEMMMPLQSKAAQDHHWKPQNHDELLGYYPHEVISKIHSTYLNKYFFNSNCVWLGIKI